MAESAPNKKDFFVYIVALVVILLIVVVVLLRERESSSTADLTDFVACLKTKGIKIYGAAWCPHCQTLKKSFGAAAAALPYVECQKPNAAQGEQTLECVAASITHYPTVRNALGAEISTAANLQSIASFSGCQLP